jgi:hypothetical protein
MSGLRAERFPEEEVRRRARLGVAGAFPSLAEYGTVLYGAGTEPVDGPRLVPPIFMPRRLEALIDLGREPLPDDVAMVTVIGGFRSAMPVYVSAFGSTKAVGPDLGVATAEQAGRAGVPMVCGENIVPVHGYGRIEAAAAGLLGRISAYCDQVPDGLGGVVVQQSTEDADAEVWNLVYSDPSAQPLLNSERLGFELKVGQGAKPGLGGMTVVSSREAERLARHFAVGELCGDGDHVLRSSSPGTFTEEILYRQILLMRNNYPLARIWVKLPPGRDIAHAAETAWRAGADAVTVDGAEGGTGWAPPVFVDHVGLPLVECLRQIGPTPAGCLLASGRMWEGARIVRCLALGARAAGLGRAALLAVDESADRGLTNLLACLALEIRLLVSALGKYDSNLVGSEDVWSPAASLPERTSTP